MPKHKYPKITLTFPTYNGGDEALDFLDSATKLNYPKDKLEIIVVDNASTDNTIEKIKSYADRLTIKIIKNESNKGFSKTVNQAIKASNGKYILITNDDIVLGKNSIKTLIEYQLVNPNIGILGGKIYSKDKPKKVISSGYLMNKWNGRVFINPNYNKQVEPDWVQGCALLIPKKVLDEVGLLDSGYSHFFEDYDLAIRSKNAGYKVVYIPKALFWHRESTTANRDKPKKYYHWYRNKFRFILKNLRLPNIVSIFLIQTLLVTPYRALILRDGRFIPFLRGFSWNIVNLSKTLAARKFSKTPAI